jgi:hypothetical protein
MKMSDSIAQLAEALSKAQGQIDAAAKANVNSHFKNKYADLNSLREAIREPLATNDLSVIQLPRFLEKEVEVETMLMHKSGEFIAETLRMPVGQMTAQAVGSALTYCRRYSLSSILNLAAEDDDGNAATQQSQKAQKAEPPTASKELISDAEKAASRGTEILRVFWQGIDPEDRTALQPMLNTFKRIAEKADAKEPVA